MPQICHKKERQSGTENAHTHAESLLMTHGRIVKIRLLRMYDFRHMSGDCAVQTSSAR